MHLAFVSGAKKPGVLISPRDIVPGDMGYGTGRDEI